MKRLALLLALAGASAPASAAEKWTMVRSPTLTVVGDESAGRLRDIALDLERFRAVVGGLIKDAQRPLAVPTMVFVFGTHKAMAPFLPLSNGSPASIGGYFQRDRDLNSIVMQTEGYEDSATIVYHEYTHLLVGNAVRWVPVWLNEGMAEYYSTYAIAANGKEADIGRPVARHVFRLRERFLPLDQLIGVSQSSELYNEGERRSIFYAESWALVHYLMSEVPGGPAQINQYVVEMTRGAEAPVAFRGAFGATPREFEKRLQAYVDGARFKSRTFRFTEKFEAAPLEKARVLPPGEAGAWLGDLQRRAQRPAEAAARIDAAIAADPSVAVAQRSLALLRIAQKRPDQAWPAFERALALEPDDFLTQFQYGVNVFTEDAAGGTPEGVDARARSALLAATRLRPDSSEAFAWLAYADMHAGRLDEARNAIDEAIALAPGRLDYRLRWADVAILDGRIEAAAALLKELAALTVDTRTAAMARARLDAIDAARLPRGPNRSITVSQDRPPEPPTGKTLLLLRKVEAGETRELGVLTQVECSKAGVRFHVKVGERDVTATAKRLEDVELTEYIGRPDFTVGCGARKEAETVYLTWRTDSGVAVALEFLPKSYVP